MLQSPLRSPISLSALTAVLATHEAELVGVDVEVTHVVQDSRHVGPGSLFAVRDGLTHRGADFIEPALGAGARAVLVARGSDAAVRATELGVSYVAVRDVNAALGPVAQELCGRPAQALSVVGVTGTNGKTTTVTLLRQALTALGYNTAQLGTLGFEFAGVHVGSGLTTPEPERIAEDMATARSAGVTHFAMEVSSHALAQERVSGISFSVVAFSNLTRDHLDFHGSFEAYAATKLRLFCEYPAKHRVVNIDDAVGATWAQTLTDAGHRVLRVSRNTDADVRLHALKRVGRSHVLDIRVHEQLLSLPTELLGEHNFDNLLLVVGILAALGVPLAGLPAAALALRGAPGRLERCDGAQDDVTVLVDYAHTPDALARVIEACRGTTRGRLLLVFGCGGDRDPGKRPQMGGIAAQGADFSWVTSDNPRSEDPADIAQQIVRGMDEGRGRFEVCLDRAQAIATAVAAAAPGDTVLIAGKGHEDYQILGATRIAFDDRVEARTALTQRRVQGGPIKPGRP